MIKVKKLSFCLGCLLAFNVAYVQSSSFSEIELVETNDWEEIDFSFCFTEHYNDIDIPYQEAYQTAQCFYDTSEQLRQSYCLNESTALLNDLLSGMEYTLSWLEKVTQFPQANGIQIAGQALTVKEIIDDLSSESPSLICLPADANQQ